MRFYEFISETTSGATASGGIATVSQPLGAIQRRIAQNSSAKRYANQAAPSYWPASKLHCSKSKK